MSRRAERRLGELVAAQKATVGMNRGTAGTLRGRDASGGSKLDPPEDARPTLAAAGIDKHLADQARKLAAVPEEEFEAEVAQWRGRVTEEQGRVTARLATLKVGANQHVEISTPSQADAAQRLNVSRDSVQAARKVLEHGAPELVRAVEQGRVAVPRARIGRVGYHRRVVSPEARRSGLTAVPDKVQ